MLDVGQNDSSELRLIVTSELETASHLSYVALSHCWGGVIPNCLSEENADSMKESIVAKTLPENFQHAISITRGIGVRYLWIDSLCIIQNSEDDKKRETQIMGQVYAKAICTISATASADSKGGCFFPVKRFIGDCSLRKQGEMSLIVTFPGQAPADYFQQEVENVREAPLTGRGWTFQERVLARRVLHFCKGITLFECNTSQASSCHIYSKPYAQRSHVRVDGKLSFSVGPSPPPAPPRPDLPRLPPLPHLPSFVPRHSWSIPEFSIRGSSEGRYIRTTERVWDAGFSTRPLTRPARGRYVDRNVWLPNPSFDADFYDFGDFSDFFDFFDSRDFFDFHGFYHFSDFYNLHQSYNSFKEYASWRSQTVTETTDMSARLGMRGAFEMLLRYEGQKLEEKLEFHDSWYQIVERYSTRKLTFDADKVPAIQGIAYFIAKETNFNFIAGLWIELLPFNLLWVLKGHPQKRPYPSRLVPTWSWASVDVSDDGKISHLLNEAARKTSGAAWKDIKILISDMIVRPMLKDNSTLVVDTLELTCRLFRLDLDKIEFIPDIIIPQHSTDDPELNITTQQSTNDSEPHITIQQSTDDLEPDVTTQHSTNDLEPEVTTQHSTNDPEPEVITQPSTDDPAPDITTQHSTEELFYLPILSLKTAYGPNRQQQLHGIVLKAKPIADDRLEFQRVGYFWTAERHVATEILGSLTYQQTIRIV